MFLDGLKAMFVKKRAPQAAPAGAPPQENPGKESPGKPYCKLLGAQLVARHLKTGESGYRTEYEWRMQQCGVTSDKVRARVFEYEADILRANDRADLLADEAYLYSWYFSLAKPLFQKPIHEYVGKGLFTPSEAMKMFDEARWHFAYSHEKPLSDQVWSEIFITSTKGELLEEVVNRLPKLGMTDAQATAWLKNEMDLIWFYKWKKPIPHPYEKNPIPA